MASKKLFLIFLHIFILQVVFAYPFNESHLSSVTETGSPVLQKDFNLRYSLDSFIRSKGRNIPPLAEDVFSLLKGVERKANIEDAESNPPQFQKMMDIYLSRSRQRRYNAFFMEKIDVDVRVTDGDKLFYFVHGDGEGVPDKVYLNRKLFSVSVSDEARVFILRHCIDKFRYDIYKTLKNDIKYLLKLEKELNEKMDECFVDDLFQELLGIKDIDNSSAELLGFLRETYNFCRINNDFSKKLGHNLSLGGRTKDRIRKYRKIEKKSFVFEDKFTVEYNVTGNPDAEETLIFVHGILVNGKDFRGQITYLEDYERFKIISIDFPYGTGGPEILDYSDPNIKHFTRAISKVMDDENVKNAVIVGHSMGGMAVLNLDDLYERDSRVKGTVLITTVARMPAESFLIHRWPEKLLGKDKVMQNILIPALERLGQLSEFIGAEDIAIPTGVAYPFMLKTIELVVGKDAYRLFKRTVLSSVLRNKFKSIGYAMRALGTHEVRDRLPDIKVPVLWMKGGEDRVTFDEDQAEDIALIPEQYRTVVTFKKSSHYPHVVHAREVNRAIADWLGEKVFPYGNYKFVIARLGISDKEDVLSLCKRDMAELSDMLKGMIAAAGEKRNKVLDDIIEICEILNSVNPGLLNSNQRKILAMAVVINKYSAKQSRPVKEAPADFDCVSV